MTDLSIASGTIESDFHAVAVNGTEMLQAREKIQRFLQSKLADIDAEQNEIQAALDAAVRNKWNSKTFRSQLSRIRQKHLYYSKLLVAVDAGYTIVPNMDVDVFAIRTKRELPIQEISNTATGYKPNPSLDDEQEQRLQIGEGQYENPRQLTTTERLMRKTPEGKEEHTTIVRAVDYMDLEFPLAVAHPRVMDATSAAMALKIFDRIGIVPQSIRRGDPIVLGQITRKEGWQTKTASFLIAWYLDVRTL